MTTRNGVRVLNASFGYEVEIDDPALERAFVARVAALSRSMSGPSIRKVRHFPPTYCVVGMDRSEIHDVAGDCLAR